MGTKTSVSIVIRCLNEEKYIGRLLDGIAKQSFSDVELIIVDSGSTDRTLSIVSEYPVKLLTISPEEFSFGRSLNIGCDAATNDIIVIASAHVYPTYSDWIESMLEPFSDPDIALVYGKQRGDTTSKFSEHQLLSRWFPDESNLDQDYPFSNNANAAIRRSLWQECPYDEELTGLEDTDWANKAMAQGYKISYISGAEVIHVHNESAKQICNRYRREAIALKKIFPQERFGYLDFVTLWCANVITDLKQAKHDHVVLRSLTDILVFRTMQFWGTLKGFQLRGPVTTDLKRKFYYPNSNLTVKLTQHDGDNTQTKIKYEDI